MTRQKAKMGDLRIPYSLSSWSLPSLYAWLGSVILRNGDDRLETTDITEATEEELK